ncbi:zinc finger BED domain-containing protein DAYSLEEPER-like [Tachysurus ichikawai]
MKCAFKVKLPQQSVDPAIDSEEEIDNLDDEDLWEDLVIGDGLKEAKFISLAISKASKLTSLLHSSTTFKSRFEAAFGNKSLPVANVTRWNSTFKQVQAITGLAYKILAEVCVKDFENVMFTLREWNQLQELSAVLGPFSEATDLTQVEKSVTISMVVPTVLDLNTHLLKMGETRSQCQPLFKALHISLQRRFSGIFVKAKMGMECEEPMPFYQDVYFLSAMLDPQFGLNWVDLDVTNHDATSLKKFREDVKRTLTNTLISAVESMAESDTSQQPNADDSSQKDSPPIKLPWLVARYKAHKSQRNLTVDASVCDRISKYFTDIQDPCTDTALVFWSKNKDKQPQLHTLAVKLLSVPASSAPVERIFSRGGLIMRPHRARLDNTSNSVPHAAEASHDSLTSALGSSVCSPPPLQQTLKTVSRGPPPQPLDYDYDVREWKCSHQQKIWMKTELESMGLWPGSSSCEQPYEDSVSVPFASSARTVRHHP